MLDTNVLISSAGNPATIYNAWEDGKFTLLSCAEHLEELRATLQKPRIAGLIKPYTAGRLVNQIKRLAKALPGAEQPPRAPPDMEHQPSSRCHSVDRFGQIAEASIGLAKSFHDWEQLAKRP